jgi:hypothetical protein
MVCYYEKVRGKLMAAEFGRTIDPAPIYHTVPRELLTNTGDVVDVMETHHASLERAGLGQFGPFSGIYYDVTRRAHRRLEEGGYDCPEVVAAAIPNFAKRWFDHLLNYADGNRDAIPGIWMLGFEDPAMLAAEPATQFSIGMLGHIDVDLGKTVYSLGAPRAYKRDYSHHISDVLIETAEAQSEDLLPVNALVRYLMTKGVLQLISAKRELAWQQGKLLMAAGDNVTEREMIEAQVENYGLLSGQLMLYAGNVALKQAQRFVPAGGLVSTVGRLLGR